jgi:hypothetical protein
MSTVEPILEQWIARTIQSYPSSAAAFLSGEEDPFRNPVGHTLRQSLTTLYHELQGSMDATRIASALDAIVRIRAVQDLSPSQAVGFVFLLKPIVREFAPERGQALLAGQNDGRTNDRTNDQINDWINDRIDQLALLAFDKYMQCREQVAEIRKRESWQRVGACQAAG